jgi:hypothetical protein
MNPTWREFRVQDRKLKSIERRLVLVITARTRSYPPAVAVGYLKFGAGDRQSPYFVIPGGAGGDVRRVTHWADVLGDDFSVPDWGGLNRATPIVRKIKGPPAWPDSYNTDSQANG